MKKVVAVILGGGRGTRLYPLTRYRSKPAVPVGGKYRLIDIPVSNCVNDNIRQILVLTQFNSESLNRHVAQTYRFDRFTDGFVSILAAEQTFESHQWFQGTADAVRQSLRHIQGLHPDLVLILSGDQLYRMNFKAFISHFHDTSSDIAIATKPVSRTEASGMGIMKVDGNGIIKEFKEKPDDAALDSLASIQNGVSDQKPFLGSMGIYLFAPEVLEAILEGNPDETDFGKEIIPGVIGRLRVSSYLFNGYWSDIGTISSFFEANIDLASDNPQFDMYRNFSPLYTRARALPGARIDKCTVDNSIVCDASDIRGGTIRSSIVGIRGYIRKGSILEDTVFMGADYWEGHYRDPGSSDSRLPALGVGENCVIRKAIIDKNARIGNGAKLVNTCNIDNYDGDGYFIREGIIVVPKNGVILAGKEV